MSVAWTPEKLERLHNLWASDLPTPEVAAALKIHVDTLYSKSRELGLPKRYARRAKLNDIAIDIRETCQRSAYAAQTAELVSRYVALAQRVQSERAAA